MGLFPTGSVLAPATEGERHGAEPPALTHPESDENRRRVDSPVLGHYDDVKSDQQREQDVPHRPTIAAFSGHERATCIHGAS